MPANLWCNMWSLGSSPSSIKSCLGPLYKYKYCSAIKELLLGAARTMGFPDSSYVHHLWRENHSSGLQKVREWSSSFGPFRFAASQVGVLTVDWWFIRETAGPLLYLSTSPISQTLSLIFLALVLLTGCCGQFCQGSGVGKTYFAQLSKCKSGRKFAGSFDQHILYNSAQ